MIKSIRNGAYLIFSDIHADIKALNTIIDVINNPGFIKRYGSVNTILNLGDTVGRGYHPVKVTERLIELGKQINIVSIMGNHDESFLYDWPVSGNDAESIKAHEDLNLDFLNDLRQYYIDYKKKILAVHGGPLNPDRIAPHGLEDYDKWHYQRTWQRISKYEYEYPDNSGYHYIPKNAFIHARDFLDNGFIIFCGHQHIGAVYRNMGEKIDRMSEDHMDVRKETYAGYVVHVNEFEREIEMNYLIRVGIAGPEGYYKKYGWNKSYFALLWEEKGMQKVGLFETQLEY